MFYMLHKKGEQHKGKKKNVQLKTLKNCTIKSLKNVSTCRS